MLSGHFFSGQKAGGEARIVGGAVRDWLAKRRVDDIDMAVCLPIRSWQMNCANMSSSR